MPPRQDPPDQLTVRQKFLIHKWQFLPLRIVTDLARSNGHVRRAVEADCDNVMAAAFYGLLAAARGFKPELGFQFSTYATHAIRRHIKVSAVSPFAPVRIPPTAWSKDHTKDLADKALYGRSINYSASSGDKESSDLAKVLIAKNQRGLPEEDIEAIRIAISKLPEKMQVVIRLRFWQSLTLEQIGEQIGGLTKERARQILMESILQLKELLQPKPKKEKKVDLFNFAKDVKRQKLRDRNCTESRGFNDARYWLLPDGRTIPEEEAFRWLVEQENPSE